jgi:radical SAM protein with 4Fe4S-binding SPASM domain
MKVIEKACELYPEGVKSISFFGGEPLLNYNTIKIFIPECIKFFKTRNLAIPVLSIMTNGVLLDDEKIKFCAKYNITVGLSLDGPKEFNDFGRLLRSNSDSAYSIVKKRIELLKKNNVACVIQFTINKKHIEDYEVGDFKKWMDSMPELEDINVAYVPVETEICDLKIHGKDNFEKLVLLTRDITNYYIDELKKKSARKLATGIYANLIQIAKNKYQPSCSAGHSLFADTDGHLYPCHMYCNDDNFILGAALEGWVDEDRINENANLDRLESDICKECISQNVCPIWCKGLNHLVNSNQFNVIDVRCVFQKTIVEEGLKALVKMKENASDYEVFVKNLKIINDTQKTLFYGY